MNPRRTEANRGGAGTKAGTGSADERGDNLAPLPLDIERVLRDEIETLRAIAQDQRREVEVQKARADHWRELCQWAYAASSAALMMLPGKPREAREAREQALCDINKRLGGAIR